jgi:hypothetical protein
LWRCTPGAVVNRGTKNDTHRTSDAEPGLKRAISDARIGEVLPCRRPQCAARRQESDCCSLEEKMMAYRTRRARREARQLFWAWVALVAVAAPLLGALMLDVALGVAR